jgi:hypothetical protein
METYVAQRVVSKSKTITLKDLPFEEGDTIKIIVERMNEPVEKPFPTVQDWLDSGLLGMWADRDDIGDTLEFAQKLREEVEAPRVTIHDFD